MDKDLIAGNLGTIGKYDLAFTGGKIVFTLGLGLGEVGVGASLSVLIGPKEILDLIAAKIGGPIPLEVAQFLEAALALG